MVGTCSPEDKKQAQERQDREERERNAQRDLEEIHRRTREAFIAERAEANRRREAIYEQEMAKRSRDEQNKKNVIFSNY